MQTGFTDSPKTEAASPAAKIFRAALMSRSCNTIAFRIKPAMHFERHLRHSIPTLRALLTGWIPTINVDQCAPIPMRFILELSDKLRPACITDGLRQTTVFLHITDSQVSMAITWFSLISRVESLCRKSLRESAVLACNLATLSLALMRLAEPLFFYSTDVVTWQAVIHSF